VARVSRVVPWVVGVAVAVAAAQAQAQSNLDAGKSPAQIFSDTCNACHRSPRELKQTSPGFLREHYTTGGREAAAMAAYLSSVGSDARAVQQRRPPAMGAGQAAATDSAPRPPQTTPPGTDQAKPTETQAALPVTPPGRRTPTEQAKPPQGPATAAAVKPRRPSESIETGKLPEAGATEAAPSQAAAAPRQHPAHEFEE
jgi:hypothetical protein